MPAVKKKGKKKGKGAVTDARRDKQILDITRWAKLLVIRAGWAGLTLAQARRTLGRPDEVGGPPNFP